jgi:hypothetical protein
LNVDRCTDTHPCDVEIWGDAVEGARGRR